MIARLISNGRSAAGLVRYCSHDRPTDAEPAPTTSERVALGATLGAPTDDIDLAVRIMQGTVADAAYLKRVAGVSAAGRKVKQPYAHLVTSWARGENPSREEILGACRGALAAVGLEEHHTIVIVHTDTEHTHAHMVSCRIHPETGRSNAMPHCALKLQEYSEEWDRQHDTSIPSRTAAIAARTAFKRLIAEEMAAFDASGDAPVDDQVKAPVDDQVTQRRQVLAAAKQRARAAHPLPKTRPRCGPGRAARTPAQQARWDRLYQRQRQQKTAPDVALEQRRRLSRWHGSRVGRAIDGAHAAARDAVRHVATAARAPARDAAAAVRERAGRIRRAVSATLDEVRDIAREAGQYFSPAARAQRRQTTAVLRQVRPLDSSPPSLPTSRVRPAADQAPGEPPAAATAGFVDDDEQHEPAPVPPEHLQPTPRPRRRPAGRQARRHTADGAATTAAAGTRAHERGALAAAGWARVAPRPTVTEEVDGDARKPGPGRSRRGTSSANGASTAADPPRSEPRSRTHTRPDTTIGPRTAVPAGRSGRTGGHLAASPGENRLRAPVAAAAADTPHPTDTPKRRPDGGAVAGPSLGSVPSPSSAPYTRVK